MKMQNEKSEYEIQAEAFLIEHGITFDARFLFHGPHWEGDKENRNVWELFLIRNGRRISVRYGQSIADSFLYPQDNSLVMVRWGDRRRAKNPIWCENHKSPSTHKKPTAYEMLACLTKYDPGTFEDFCSDYGFDTDSRRAERSYFAVQEEWKNVRSFFSTEEIEKLSEIN